jgi:hypothetical protein
VGDTKAKVYVETTVVSYLTAWASRDIILAAQQQMTRDWWARREEYDPLHFGTCLDRSFGR